MARTRKTAPAAAQATVDEPSVRIEFMRLDVLTRWPRNPKRHDEPGIAASMGRFGFIDPIIIDEKTQRIVSGHGRLDVLTELHAGGKDRPARLRADADGMWLIPVLRGIAFKDEREAEAYLVGTNRLVEIGGYDDELLASLLAEMREHVDGLDGTGFTDEQAQDIIASIASSSDDGTTPDTRTPPGDFKDYDVDSKRTTQCPKCGFAIVSE